tara:strand:- start:29 stop:709 length:681 start_codon:yes stop_codon:yes gene_type:complete
MKVIRKPSGYWDIKENVLEDALKHDTKESWYKSKGGARSAAQKNGWYEEATAHMKTLRKSRGDYLAIQMEKIEKAGIPKDSPVGKRFSGICSSFWSKYNMSVTAEDFLALIKITKPNGKGAVAFDPIGKVWLDILETSVHAHHCISGKVILFFAHKDRNAAMGHLGDTPFSFIELTHTLVSAGAKIPKNKLDETKELLRKLNEAVNKMDSGLCDIVPKRFSFKNQN